MKYPGIDHVYVLCDVCGRKVRRKDTVKVRDRHNFQNNLIVCKWDVDETNEQNKPHRIKEEIISQPKMMRSEPSDRYATPDTDDRAPGAPRQLVAKASTLGSDIELFWQGPFDVGTSQITGYKIERANPQFGGYDTLTSDSGSGNTYYLDTTGNISDEYTYRVSAINGAGTGAVSNEAFYPNQRVESTVNYLTVSQTNNVLRTGQGDDIIL